MTKKEAEKIRVFYIQHITFKLESQPTWKDLKKRFNLYDVNEWVLSPEELMTVKMGDIMGCVYLQVEKLVNVMLKHENGIVSDSTPEERLAVVQHVNECLRGLM